MLKRKIVLNIMFAALFAVGVFITVLDNVLITQAYTSPPPAPTLSDADDAQGDTDSAAQSSDVQGEKEPSQTETPADDVSAQIPSPTDRNLITAPVKIYFNDAEVSASIEPVGLTEDGAMDAVASATVAGWYEDGPSPGQYGNALIDGHVRWKGRIGTFSVLNDMQVGDEVVIEYEDGSFRYFYTQSVNVYLLEEFPPEVMATDEGGEPRLTLITCLGDYDQSIGTSRSRVVVVLREE